MNIGSLVLCVGPERWLRQEAVAELKRGCLAAGFEETDFIRFSNPETESQTILEAARTAPFGSPRRLVLVDGLEELTPESVPWLEDLLVQPNSKSCVVLCADRSKLPRSVPIQVILCQPLQGPALEDWVVQRCRWKGKEIEGAAAAELVRRLGSGLQALDLALDSLVLMAGDSPILTRAAVEALVAPSLQQTAFEILDAAVAGRTGAAMRGLREAMALNRIGMDQFLGAVGWTLRHRMQRWPAPRLQEILEELLQTDTRIKQGHPSPEWLVDRLLLKLR